MTVSRVRQVGVGVVAASAAAIVVTPFIAGMLALKMFAIAVLALPVALAAIALPRTANPRRATALLASLFIAFETAGLYVAGFEGTPTISLGLMAGLALVPLVVLGSLYAWVYSETDKGT